MLYILTILYIVTVSVRRSIDLKYKGGIATLTIKEVFPEDEGTYVCTATNSIGSVTTTCKLTINRKYKLDKKKFLPISKFKKVLLNLYF